jgi:PAS domain S-box-containing protein
MTASASRPFVASRRAWLFAVMAALLVLATEQVIEHYAQQSELEEERGDVLNRLSTLRARLEGVVNINLSLVHGLTAVIESRPDIDQAGFAAIADGLVSERYALRNIGAAPGMVLSLMYPLAGNEAALGLDYRSHPQQREAALRARDSGRTVIAGPVDLQQGGVAIIARKPVFLPPLLPGGEKRFWGLVSAAIDVETLYQQAGFLDSDLGLRIALRGSNASGSSGPLFFGDAALFNADPVSVEVTLPGGGSWQMVAIPAEGWGRADAGVALLRLLSFLVALAAALITYRLLRSAEVLASQSARMHALLHTIPDLVWLKDANGVYLSGNPRFEKFFGAREAEIRGKTDHDFVPAELADFFRESDRAAIAAGAPRVNEEWVSFASDGHRELLEIIKAPVYDERGGLLGVLGIARDITQRKQAEARLREQEAFFRLIAENMGDMVAVLDLQGCLVYDSKAYRALFGKPDALPDRDPFALVHPDDREHVRQAFQTTIATGLGQRGTYRVVLPDGSVRDIESQGGVIRDTEGRVTQVVVVSRDVSERTRMEDEIRQLNSDLEERVRQRTRELDAANKELQTFTYSVSHDLKAPLRGIDGYSRLLLEDHREQLDEEGRLFLDKVRHGVAHMGRLIEDLLAYSRLERRHLHGRTLDLAEQVGMLLDSRRVELQAAGMIIEVRLHGLSACADPAGLDMVLRNLLDNALKFTRDSEPPMLTISGSQSDQSVTLAISDNGIGFDMRFHERIFEIFQRLQRAEDYPGTGVGLAIVHKAMQRMGGRVWAQSQPGHGATFYLELPR